MHNCTLKNPGPLFCFCCLTVTWMSWTAKLITVSSIFKIASYCAVISSWVSGSLAVSYDPRDPSKNGDPFDPWPMTHWPTSISVHSPVCNKRLGVSFWGSSSCRPHGIPVVGDIQKHCVLADKNKVMRLSVVTLALTLALALGLLLSLAGNGGCTHGRRLRLMWSHLDVGGWLHIRWCRWSWRGIFLTLLRRWRTIGGITPALIGTSQSTGHACHTWLWSRGINPQIDWLLVDHPLQTSKKVIDPEHRKMRIPAPK